MVKPVRLEQLLAIIAKHERQAPSSIPEVAPSGEPFATL